MVANLYILFLFQLMQCLTTPFHYRFAYLYDVDGDVVEGHLNGYHATGSLLSYGWQSPASSLFSCGKDIMRFLSFLLNRDGSNANNFPLHASTVRDWLLPRFSNPDGASAFGMPWEMFFVASESVPGRGYWSYNKVCRNLMRC